MSYRCGIGAGLQKVGLTPGPPRVMCDGCGERLVINPGRMPPAWLLDNRAAPGWKLERVEDFDSGILLRRDWCQVCKHSVTAVDVRQPAVDEHF